MSSPRKRRPTVNLMTSAPELSWAFRSWQGHNDGVAPHRGGYYIADLVGLDLIARAWCDAATGVWWLDVTEADEIEYGGTPCIREEATSREATFERAEEYIAIVAAPCTT
jgi:hypothetical protein